MEPIIADAGLPMLFVHLPAMLVALVPVVAAETYVARRYYGLDQKKALKGVAIANCCSTLLGFPLLWLLWAVTEATFAGRALGLDGIWRKVYAVTVQSAWLIPYEGDLGWMIPVAGLFMLIPAFFVSVYVERWLLRVLWADESVNRVRSFSWRAHFVSYPVLIAVWLAFVLLPQLRK